MSELRRHVHGLAEPSGREQRTAAFLAELLASCNPALLLSGMGGHGLAAEFRGGAPGPRLGLRAELDAVACGQGARHVCGHDGHLALLAGVALHLAQRPLTRGSLVLILQPAEETGQGAAAFLADRRWSQIAPDMVFALHNLPGLPLGALAARSGVMNLASVGLGARLRGAASHAAQPAEGLSPAPALTGLLARLPGLAGEGELITLTHARLGEESFGVSPGEALLCATLRAPGDRSLSALRDRAARLVADLSAQNGLMHSLTWPEPFTVTRNHPVAVDALRRAAAALCLDFVEPEEPYPWSEDFGCFTAAAPGALFCLGAGESCPALHSADYVFPDQLLARGLDLWLEVISQVMGA